MKEILNSNGIILIDSHMYFTPDERKKLKEMYEAQSMEIFFLEQRSIKNSIFDGIEIILNNNLFNMLVGGLLMPAAYELIKNSLTLFVKNFKKGNIKFLDACKKPEPVNTVIKIKLDRGEIIAPIDQELSPEEMEEYIDALITAWKIANKTTGSKHQYFIIDKVSDGGLEILLLPDYLKKHNKN
ncbi:hypothetical protein AJM39_09485 [Listeria monocytogenes]|uniref:hypothetical protein n=1 Tax=Listeria monocytogenes TaxID=1639 RepID=UPI00086E7844|nr:hypothetical protein [Listeria monocytogenes]EHW1482456.1 hypothetical protein [Listeria monocytogenes]OEP32287.1 hypothetical protein AJM39_09485 [Listeria monocytogenes]OFE60272.1 hypothetical protein AJL47_05195 [Listeria monocytogenes]